jgi:type I restriction enzyme M protein
LGDGLDAVFKMKPAHQKHVSIVANPPYTEIVATAAMTRDLHAAFPGVSTKLGHKRAELYFLARSLLLAKKTRGTVSVLMPMGFADGDIYSQYRASLMVHYGLLKAIEVSAVFEQTEARTVLLVIDTSKHDTRDVEVSRYDPIKDIVSTVYYGPLKAGERLDARYQEGKILVGAVRVRLQDIGVTVVRGRVSYKESRDLAMPAVHTTDLSKAMRGKLDIVVQTKKNAKENAYFSAILAEEGDILLSRTGTRVSWKPIVISSGRAPITDHVFRIRVPPEQQQRVTRAFSHPAFEPWLASVSKGVCATVITKKDLMTMPIFE